MKILEILLLLISILNHAKSSKENQALLSNQEIKEVLKCFGDLNLDEGCVICRYITQKIYKVLDISAMCPDIVDTKLLAQREREWKPDPQVINKWTVLYNLQKDYMTRILPQVEANKNYNEVMQKKLNQEKEEKLKLANLIQFQNKVNKDLKHEERSKFNPESEDCEDEDSAYKRNQSVASSKAHLTDFNKLLVKEIKSKITDKQGEPVLNKTNKSILLNSMKNFIKKSKNNEFNFKEKLDNLPNIVHNYDEAVKNLSSEDIIKAFNNSSENSIQINLKLNPRTKGKDQHIEINEGDEISKNKTSFNLETKKEERKIKKIKLPMLYNISVPQNIASEEVEKSQINGFNVTLKNETNTNIPLLEDTINKYNVKSDPVLNINIEPTIEETKKILNPPIFSSFISNFDEVSIINNNLISKSNFNLETQRRGRRRSRFPDPQWDCAEAQISKLVRYLCEEEVSSSYQKYCKPIFEQINTMIESFLYHDNNLEVCQNLHMCPVTVEV